MIDPDASRSHRSAATVLSGIPGQNLSTRCQELLAYALALETARDACEATIMAVVHTLGGEVDGLPTARHNFLQRLRALVAQECVACKGAERIEDGRERLDAIIASGDLDRETSHQLVALDHVLRDAKTLLGHACAGLGRYQKRGVVR
jgi:hypothetical protein